MSSRDTVSMAATVLAVFDLDGTLIDSRRDLADSANVMLAGYGARPLDDEHITSMVGCGAATLVKRVMTAADVDAPLEEGLARFLAAYDERLTQYTRPYTGIPDLLDELRSRAVTMALLTNSHWRNPSGFSTCSDSRNISGGSSAATAHGQGSPSPMA